MSYTIAELRDYSRGDVDAMLDWAASELERLQAIVVLLPKDGSGKPIPPNVPLWIADPHRGVVKVKSSPIDVVGNPYGDLQWSNCYLEVLAASEAVEKARSGG